jgi:hypothetical protein
MGTEPNKLKPEEIPAETRPDGRAAQRRLDKELAKQSGLPIGKAAKRMTRILQAKGILPTENHYSSPA